MRDTRTTLVPGSTGKTGHRVVPKVLDGRNAHLTDRVQRTLDRQPRDFAAYVRVTAATGVWEA